MTLFGNFLIQNLQYLFLRSQYNRYYMNNDNNYDNNNNDISNDNSNDNDKKDEINNYDR